MIRFVSIIFISLSRIPGLSGNQARGIAVLFLLMLSQDIIGQNNNIHPDIYSLSFQSKSNVLERGFSNNSITLNNLVLAVSSSLSDIKKETVHIEITGYIVNEKTDDLYSLNEISIQASVVRAYLKTKYGLDNSCFIFNIDNSLNISNIIGVAIRSCPVPAGSNKNIFYTFNPTSNSLNNVFIQYDSIPYKQKEITFEIEPSVEEKPILKIDNMFAKADSVLSGFAIPYKTNQPPVFKEVNLSKVEPEIKIAKQLTRSSLRPYVAIKTNAIYWAGFSPSLERGRSDYIPNIEMEFYFASRFSTSIDGFYAPVNRRKTGTEWWYSDGIAIEQRIWLNNKGINRGTYRGFYAGFYGITGEFDIMQQSLGNYGYTGDYYGAGISAGYAQPLFRSGFAIEVGVRGGYRIDNWESYETDNGSFYFVDSGTQSGFRLQGLRLSIMYRFGRKIKNIVK